MMNLRKILERILYMKRTPSELDRISSEIRTILDDLFGGGTYTLSVLPDKYTRDGIYIWLDAHVSYPSP